MSNTDGFSSGGNPAASSTLNQNSPANTQASSFSGFSLSGFATTTSGFSLSTSTTSTSASAPTLNFSSIPTTTTGATTSTVGSISFGSSSVPASTASKSVTFNFIAPSSSATLSTSKPGTLSCAPSSISSVSNAITTSAATSASTSRSINYLQLQDSTNKWITNFEDLQKTLMNQTSETITRDVMLASNEDQIEKLVESVRNLKSEQTQVEQQLDFILSQQKDLDECLASLEDEVSSYFPEIPADDMYKLAENIDSRIKKTLETSKEIITKINEKNRSSENITNPMVAIGRILNHLTNSIQMLENLNTEGISSYHKLLIIR